MITKDQFDKLYDDNISKKEYDFIIQEINKRFSEICKNILKIKPNYGWFDYGNCSYDSEQSGGFFCPVDYKEFISIGGENISCPDWLYEPEIPTRWLWQDYTDEIKQLKEEHHENEKLKKQKVNKKKQDINSLIKSIKSKLSKEELKIISFKKFEK